MKAFKGVSSPSKGVTSASAKDKNVTSSGKYSDSDGRDAMLLEIEIADVKNLEFSVHDRCLYRNKRLKSE